VAGVGRVVDGRDVDIDGLNAGIRAVGHDVRHWRQRAVPVITGYKAQGTIGGDGELAHVLPLGRSAEVFDIYRRTRCVGLAVNQKLRDGDRGAVGVGWAGEYIRPDDGGVL